MRGPPAAAPEAARVPRLPAAARRRLRHAPVLAGDRARRGRPGRRPGADRRAGQADLAAGRAGAARPVRAEAAPVPDRVRLPDRSARPRAAVAGGGRPLRGPGAVAGLARGAHAPVPAVPAVRHRPRPDQAGALGRSAGATTSRASTPTAAGPSPRWCAASGCRSRRSPCATSAAPRRWPCSARCARGRGTQTVELQRQGPDGSWSDGAVAGGRRPEPRAARSPPTARASTGGSWPTRARAATAPAGCGRGAAHRSARPPRSGSRCRWRAARPRRSTRLGDDGAPRAR